MFGFICLTLICLLPHRDSSPRWLPASTKPVRPGGSHCPGCSRPPSELLLPRTCLVHRHSETSSTHFQGPTFLALPTDERAALRQDRSEERRVGTECRSRWSPYH